MICLSKEEIKAIKDSRNDIIEGVKLLGEVMEIEDNSWEGLIFFHYGTDVITGESSVSGLYTGEDKEISAVLATLMSEDNRLYGIIEDALIIKKRLANA